MFPFSSLFLVSCNAEATKPEDDTNDNGGVKLDTENQSATKDLDLPKPKAANDQHIHERQDFLADENHKHGDSGNDLLVGTSDVVSEDLDSLKEELDTG